MAAPGRVLILPLTDDCTEERPMKDDNLKRLRHNRVWLTDEACDLDSFGRSVERSADRADYPFAVDVASNVLIYDGLEVRSATRRPRPARKSWRNGSRR